MKKYYKVYLIDYSESSINERNTIEQNYAICKETGNGLKEIITGKDVYPVADTLVPALTFGSIPDTLPLYDGLSIKFAEDEYGEAMMISMTPNEVKLWLREMNINMLNEYESNIYRLEKIAAKKYYAEQEKNQTKKSNKFISRILIRNYKNVH